MQKIESGGGSQLQANNIDLLRDHYNLVEDIAEHNCILFIGAGVSQCAGLPSSSELSMELAKDLIVAFRTGGRESDISRIEKNQENLQEIAEMYHNFFEDHKVHKKICEKIEYKQKNADIKIFEAIASLPRNEIITTNYDSLLESAFPSPEDRSMIWKEELLSAWDSRKYNIFKIHGTIHDPTSILVLKEDFSRFEKSGLYKYLIGQLQTKTLVIIGFSLSDTDFIKLYSEASPSKNLYIVTKEKDILKHTNWEKKGAKVIEIDAEKFVDKLTNAIEKYNRDKPVKEIKFVPKGEVKKEDKNPFKFYTTDGLKPEQFSELFKLFVPPYYSDFAKIYSVDKHNIIQGSRGTGKTVLLRGLSIENLLTSQTQGDFIGFWLPLSTSYLGCVKRQEDEKDEKWFKFFSSYLNTLIIEKICESLLTCEKKAYLDFEEKSIKTFIENVFSDLKIEKDTFNLSSLYNEITRIRSRYHTAYDRKTFELRTDPTYLRLFLKHLEGLHGYFLDKYFFVVLDDAQFMDEEQKKVLVSMLSHREHPISFKIGTKEEFGVYADFFGAIIQEGKDYETVYLDRFLGRNGARDYKDFIERLANKRLEAFDQQITIKELFPKGKVKKGEFYSGFGNYVVLSSQIIRDFITLVKDTIYSAYPQISGEFVSLKPIPPSLQNEVIGIKSSIHLKEVDAAGDLRDDVIILIDTLGKLFKQTLDLSLKVSPKSELRTVSGIEIKKYNELNAQTKAAVDKAVELSLLQIPITYRSQKMNSPNFGLKFHRLLIPYYKLKLPYRYPRIIDAALFNKVLIEPDRFINTLTKSLIKSLKEKESEPDHIQNEIDYYVDEDE